MFINPINLTIPGIHIKVTSFIIFIIYPNFTDKVLSKIQVLYIYISARTDISAKILSVVHIFSLTSMTYLKMLIGIKSLNTKQCPARLSPPPIKLSSFMGRGGGGGGKFSRKKGESNL